MCGRRLGQESRNSSQSGEIHILGGNLRINQNSFDNDKKDIDSLITKSDAQDHLKVDHIYTITRTLLPVYYQVWAFHRMGCIFHYSGVLCIYIGKYLLNCSYFVCVRLMVLSGSEQDILFYNLNGLRLTTIVCIISMLLV